MKPMLKNIFGILYLPFFLLSCLAIISDIEVVGLLSFLGYTVCIIIFSAYLLDSFKGKEPSFYFFIILFVEFIIMDFAYLDHKYLHW